jgi:hypothetical protein
MLTCWKFFTNKAYFIKYSSQFTSHQGHAIITTKDHRWKSYLSHFPCKFPGTIFHSFKHTEPTVHQLCRLKNNQCTHRSNFRHCWHWLSNWVRPSLFIVLNDGQLFCSFALTVCDFHFSVYVPLVSPGSLQMLQLPTPVFIFHYEQRARLEM